MIPVGGATGSTSAHPRAGTAPVEISIGFDVERDGFSFSNWAGVSRSDHLSFQSVSRLLGRYGSCTITELRPECTLRSGLLLNREQLNDVLAAGRCEGMVVLAARLFLDPGRIDAISPGATSTSELTRDETAGEIAYWWASQIAPVVRNFSERSKSISAARLGREVMLNLRLGTLVSIGIVNDELAHSVLPIGGWYERFETVFRVYDPNFPGETRLLRINNETGAWRYPRARLADGSIGAMIGVRSGLDYVPIVLRDKDFNWELPVGRR